MCQPIIWAGSLTCMIGCFDALPLQAADESYVVSQLPLVWQPHNMCGINNLVCTCCVALLGLPAPQCCSSAISYVYCMNYHV